MLKCNVIMTEDPVCCLPDETVAAAAQKMKEKNVGSIPIIESEQSKKLIGIVTDRDLALQVVAESRDASATKIADVMTRKVIYCHVDEDLDKVMDTMAKYQLRRLPVVEDGNKIVGIISQADIATRVDKPEDTAKVVKEISQPYVEDETPLMPEY